MRYRCADVAGGTYFFTVNLAERKRTLLVDHVDALRKVMQEVKLAHPFHIDAMVILPDHLHALWTLPAGDCDYPTRWMLIKAGFSRQIPKGERRSNSRIAKGERGIWQRRYWEHLIRDDRDFERHVDYIHYNPVKHGVVKRVVDWPYSSFHRYVASGLYPEDLAAMNEADLEMKANGDRT
jgi:putative transposase